jgi:chemotaxis protein methyltransferase CheR
MTQLAATAQRSKRSTLLVEGEFAFTAADFAQIAALLHQDSGIHLSDAKATLVYSRLAKRLRKLGVPSFAEYIALVTGPDGLEERRAMLAALTTNVTRFFREPHHFEHLRRRIAAWAPQVREGGRLRLWSAGCSTGQEPYSIAMTLLQALPEAPNLDVRILATDIDPVVLGKAREGRYGEDALEGVTADLRRAFFNRDGAGWVANDTMRRMIVFNELNLMAEWPIRTRFQAVFCRNVAIYFEPAAQERLFGRLTNALTPDGRLYIGHSERVAETKLETDGLTVYRLRGGA